MDTKKPRLQSMRVRIVRNRKENKVLKERVKMVDQLKEEKKFLKEKVL